MIKKVIANIVAINKPKGPTSFDIVAQVRRITGIKKVGHAGTLDPLAEGVLVVAICREATRQIDAIVQKEKEYIADIRLGYDSSTDDDEGTKTEVLPPPLTPPRAGGEKFKPTKKQIEQELKNFLGVILQKPPAFSAIKINGQRAYKLARAGQEPEMKAREIEIKNIQILKYKYPDLTLKILTGKGAYIRSIARDLGAALGTGGYLTGLVRTRVGSYDIKEAFTIEKFKKYWDRKNRNEAIQILKNGGIGILPTDTLYGLVGQALKPETVERIYAVRKRSPDKPFIILISSLDDLKLFGIKVMKTSPRQTPSSSPLERGRKYGKREKVSRGILQKYWPGQVSIVLPCLDEKLSYLHRGTNGLAFRLPDKKDLLVLLKKTGPLVAPSANPEGMAPALTINNARKYFHDEVDFYVNAGTLESEPSTLIKITNRKIEVLRQGAVKIM